MLDMCSECHLHVVCCSFSIYVLECLKLFLHGTDADSGRENLKSLKLLLTLDYSGLR